MFIKLFNGIGSQTVTAVMLVATVLFAVFFGVLYFFVQKKYSNLMLFLANLTQLATVIFLYSEKMAGNIAFLMFANIANVLLVTFLISAILNILEIKIFNPVLLIFNIINVIQAIIFYLLTRNNYILNVLSAIIIALLCFYGTAKLYSARKDDKKKEVIYTTAILGIFGLLNLVRGIYRLLNPLYISSFSQIDASATLFYIISLAFAFILNFSVLFLNLSALVKNAERLSYLDSLTGALSRNAFMGMLSQKLSETKRGERSIAVALLDLDDFKRINDKYGHPEGDKMLKDFIGIIKGSLRENDIVGRIGGEEFMLILEAEKKEEALIALNRIKQIISEADWINNEKMTFSCGFMMVDNENSGIQVSKIISIVDKKMYEAKTLGKNRIV